MGVPVARVLAPNPGIYTLEGTNTWIVGRDPAVVIDPGPEHEGHLRTVATEAGRVAAILLTHGHEDHAGGATRLSGMASAPIYAADSAVADVVVRDEERLRFGEVQIDVIAAPGHTPDHTVFRLPASGAMFVGDAILGRGTSVIDPPEGDLVVYLRSLERLLRESPKTLFPGHGPTIFAGELKVQEYIDHRHEREKEILDALRGGSHSIDELVATIYTDYPLDVRSLAARSVLAHLEKLKAEDRVELEGREPNARYAIAKPRVCSKCGRPVRGKLTLCQRCSMDALQEPPA